MNLEGDAHVQPEVPGQQYRPRVTRGYQGGDFAGSSEEGRCLPPDHFQILGDPHAPAIHEREVQGLPPAEVYIGPLQDCKGTEDSVGGDAALL